MAGQPPCRILVMASGNGSNFQALIDAVAAGTIPNSKIMRLIVNRAKAYATTRAEKAGMRDPRPFTSCATPLSHMRLEAT